MFLLQKAMWGAAVGGILLLCGLTASEATPANRAAMERHYDRFLTKRLRACTTCHLPNNGKDVPTSLKEFPHNAFGKRLFALGGKWRAEGRKADIAARMQAIAREDSDGDGVDNETELLLGHAPGDSKDFPTKEELANAPAKRREFAQFLASYRWQPFETVKRPAVPKSRTAAYPNPVDAFLAEQRDVRGLKLRPPAPKNILLRRVYLDLIGLNPTPQELAAFERDTTPNAYEKVVDRLLADPRYGERWGRHWMDVWRYSDWAGWADGGQIRDSKPHIWRWRDWIVESLNADKGYDRMVTEMLAADELAPEDSQMQRATGFLVRNYKLLSREQWLEDTLNHTSRAFLGVTMHCAKCHDHMYDPVTQREYYQMRAIFEPHNVRTDRIPGQPDTNKDGLVHTYDADAKAATYLFIRGDERSPDKNQILTSGVPASLGGTLQIKSVPIPRLVSFPDRRAFVIEETVKASEKAIQDAISALQKTGPDSEKDTVASTKVALMQAKHQALLSILEAERLEDDGKQNSDEWKHKATETTTLQRKAAVLEARYNLYAARYAQKQAQNKVEMAAKGMDKPAQDKANGELEAAKKQSAEMEKALEAALKAEKEPPSTAFTPRSSLAYPTESTGRRLAFARWLTETKNPLTARVAMNHLWARHFGVGIVPSMADFGRNGRLATHPKLLDWLASELMAQNWRMKPLHRLLVTSAAYKMASTSDPLSAKRDPDNLFYWRMNSRRLEAEAIRDNTLYVAGSLDLTQGGPDIDHTLGLTSKRRSLYLRTAAEKQSEFLQIFDGPSVTECYERKPSVMPQQALALANSELAITQARLLAQNLDKTYQQNGNGFLDAAFLRVLCRRPTLTERKVCTDFLAERAKLYMAPKTETRPIAALPDTPKPDFDPMLRARENLLLVLLNHTDFVTIR